MDSAQQAGGQPAPGLGSALSCSLHSAQPRPLQHLRLVSVTHLASQGERTRCAGRGPGLLLPASDKWSAVCVAFVQTSRDGVNRALIHLDMVPSTQWGRSFSVIRTGLVSWTLVSNATTGHHPWWLPCCVSPTHSRQGPSLRSPPAPALVATRCHTHGHPGPLHAAPLLSEVTAPGGSGPPATHFEFILFISTFPSL